MNEEPKIVSEEEDVASAKERRREELEREFSYDGYKVVRKELFAHLREPAVTIRDGNITFNTACINGLEDVVFVKLMMNAELGRLTVQGCEENDVNALRWCIAKPDKRKSRKMTCRPFTDLIYKVMGWDKQFRYKILGYQINHEGETLYVFDLNVPEIFRERPKKDEVLPEGTDDVDTRKGFYPDDIANTFGVSVEEYNRQTEVSEMDGYVSMAVLTGPKENSGESTPVLERRDE